ncbi:unnamed protein product [Brachionus calyciflorus]|uniref:RING-type E3 ubiquitin transferase n=1 Tax=Brachionus calyciflorus TaxID=104777 RepID=A0A813W151_9BILA|nr:unnamed protein product [Brachionus calyciflorus]
MLCSVTASLHTNSSLESTSSLSDDKSTDLNNVPEFKNINTNRLFLINDQVKLIVDLELFEQIQQESHGGWNKKMTEVPEKTIRVHRITEKGDVRIKFESDTSIRWTIYSFLLNKIDQKFESGESVLVNFDERVIKSCLKNNWDENYNKIVGQICKIISLKSNGDLLLNFNDTEYSMPRDLCYKILDPILDDNYSTANNLQESTKNAVDNFKKHGFENSKTIVNNTDQINIADYFVKKCSNGSLNKVKEVLEKFRYVLDEKSYGKTGLQASCYHGHLDIVNFLLNSGAQIDKTDLDGDTALHYACFGNQPEVVETLIKNNASLNCLNKNSCSPLHVAVNKQHVNCVRILVKYNCNTNIQDSYGDTPLHDIIGKKMTNEAIEIIDFLINSPELNFNLVNKRGFNIFHQACLKGNHIVTEKLLKKFPEVINIQKNDGYSALHLASLNGHKKIIECLLKAKVDLEMRTNRNQTALLLAISKFNFPIIEILVENYANVNAYDEDMDTGLHLISNETIYDKNSEKNSSPAKIKLSDLNKAIENLNQCEFISEVIETLPKEFKSNIRVIIAVYLIKNGANLYSRNKYNLSCLDFFKDEFTKKILIEYYSNLNCDINLSRLSLNYGLKSNESDRCKLCDEEPITVTFLPCNHKCVCIDCSIRIKKCLECHHVIKEKVDLNGTNLNFSKTEFSELLEKVKNMEEAQQCPICMERKKDTTFQCGHTVCNFCSKPLVNCHICREKIITKIRIYEN